MQSLAVYTTETFPLQQHTLASLNRKSCRATHTRKPEQEELQSKLIVVVSLLPVAIRLEVHLVLTIWDIMCIHVEFLLVYSIHVGDV